MSDEERERCPHCGAPEPHCDCWDPDDDEPYDDEFERECTTCDGDGAVPGDEIAGQYDPGWIDPEKWYRCPNCGGSGLAKDMTVW